MFIHNRLTQHVSGIIMPIVRRTDCIKPRVVLSLDVLAAVVWSRDTSWGQCVRSARVLTPHNRSQHIQANTTRGFIQTVLLMMGIMMPETRWVNLLWINICTCVICWFFLLLRSDIYVWVCSFSFVTDFLTHIQRTVCHGNLKRRYSSSYRCFACHASLFVTR